MRHILQSLYNRLVVLLGSSKNWPHGSWHSTIDDVLQLVTDFQEMSFKFQTISLQSKLHHFKRLKLTFSQTPQPEAITMMQQFNMFKKRENFINLLQLIYSVLYISVFTIQYMDDTRIFNGRVTLSFKGTIFRHSHLKSTVTLKIGLKATKDH